MDHSDSDSGDSWTLLDDTPAYADEIPNLPDISSVTSKGEFREIDDEKDEDTDGISIISDSEPESPILYEIEHQRCNDLHDMDPEICCIPINPASLDDTVLQESMIDNKFLSNNNSKHKTYVHKRNKRLSTLLNVIVLGSVITAAGVAIGHTWGAKNDCMVNKMPSINKVLSNLYKLQEENAYLRSKLKEFELNQVHIARGKSGTQTNSYKQNKCKKVFEDSILNRNSDKPIKCVDNEENLKIGLHLMKSNQENQILKEIDILEDVNNLNRTWLDYENDKQLKEEDKYIDSAKMQLGFKSNKFEKNDHNKGDETLLNNNKLQVIIKDGLNMISPQQRKISYADSLKSGVYGNDILRTDLDISTDTHSVQATKNKVIEKNINITTGYLSEEELKKGSRSVEKRHKNEKKKYDRQKLHKKQKRKNKYEKWEQKGVYLKDYGDISISSTPESEDVLKIAVIGVERHKYTIEENKSDLKSSEVKDTNLEIEGNAKNAKNSKEKEKTTWFEKRAIFRNQARKRLEQELFGNSSPNSAGWYFRRMHRREQCRDKDDNSTHRKLSKLKMNFKIKY